MCESDAGSGCAGGRNAQHPLAKLVCGALPPLCPVICVFFFVRAPCCVNAGGFTQHGFTAFYHHFFKSDLYGCTLTTL